MCPIGTVYFSIISKHNVTTAALHVELREWNHLTSKLVVCTRTGGPGARSWIFSESPLPLSYVEPRMIVNQRVATCLLQGCYKLATVVTMNGTPARQCCLP